MKRVVATCGRCGVEHDPFVTGEWLVCADCFGDALIEQSEARKVLVAA